MWKNTFLILVNAFVTFLLLPYYAYMYIINKPAKMISIGNFDSKIYANSQKEFINDKREYIKDMLNKKLKK